MASVNPNPPVSAVQQALKAEPSLKDDARNIDVSASNNKIVLRGSIKNEGLKKKAEKTAKDAASGYEIDNQLSVTEGQGQK
jgi:osmotically-inducible protein OsmY